jgi:carbamoyltransferase
MIYWGINALNHGSSLAVIKDGQLMSNEFCTSDDLDSEIQFRALNWGAPDRIFWYERPWVKKARQLYAGQYRRAFDLSVLPRAYMNNIQIQYAPITYTPHHASHAAAGYYTSDFNDAAVVVLDAIGEFECASIWHAQGDSLKKVWSRSYPNSLGLFYSAFTQLIGLTPIKDEYQLQQSAAKGDSKRYRNKIWSYFDGIVQLNYNFHRGVEHWDDPIENDQDRHDIAAAVQWVFEEQVQYVMTEAQNLTKSRNLIYMGGCAMNSQANRLFENNWDGIWSLPNPGDPSSSIGAVLYHTKDRIKWDGPLAKHIKIKYTN